MPADVVGHEILMGLVLRETAVRSTVTVEVLRPAHLAMSAGTEDELMGVRLGFVAPTRLEVVAIDRERLAALAQT